MGYRVTGYFMDYIKMVIILFGIFGFQKRLTNRKTVLLMLLGGGTISVLPLFGSSNREIMNASNILLVIMTAFNLKKAMFGLIVIPVYLLTEIADSIAAVTGAWLLRISVDELLVNNRMELVINLIGLFTIIVIFYVIKIKSSGYKRQENIDWLFYLGITSGIIGIILYFEPIFTLGMNRSAGEGRNGTVFFSLLGGSIFLTGLFVLYHLRNKNTTYQQQIKITNELIKYQKKYYEMLLDREEETKKFRHDLYYHINCVSKLLRENEVESAIQYLEDFQRTTKKIRRIIDTGNNILNIIVNETVEELKDKNISIRWRGRFADEVVMNGMDICILFSNLLRNAIEAEEVCIQKRIITEGIILIDIRSSGESLLIYMENNIAEKIEVRGKKILNSTKQDQCNRGFGTKNITEVVEKYKGNIIYNVTDNIFSTEIIFLNFIINNGYQ